LIASALLALQVGGFYWMQRRGFFSKLMRTATDSPVNAIGRNG